MGKFEDVKAKRKKEYEDLRGLRGSLKEAKAGTPEAKKLEDQIKALVETSKITKGEYDKEHEAKYGCKPEDLRSGFRIVPEKSLAGMKTTPKAMNAFMGRMARIKNHQMKKLVAFAKANGFTSLDDACVSAFCRRKISKEEKEARKIAKSLAKAKEKVQEKERKLKSLTAKAKPVA